MSALPTLEGAKVLVTGASSGIGAALAPMLAAGGATVGIAARRTDRLSGVLDACREASAGDGAADGAGHRMWTADLSDPDAATRLAVEAWDAFGHLDARGQQRRPADAAAGAAPVDGRRRGRDAHQLPLARGA